jgi:soluble lytic murein transglycosylase-like protein
VSLARVVAAVVAAAIVLAVVAWRSRGAEPVAAAASQATAPAAPAAPTAPTRSSAAPAPALARTAAPAAPELPDVAPFRDHDLAVTTDMPEGALVALRSSMRDGRNLAVELATRAPAPEGTRLFAIVSVSDRLGNTVLDCTWRDIEITDDARRLECELPLDVELPLAISGHQLPAPSFVEAPRVVAVDNGVHP